MLQHRVFTIQWNSSNASRILYADRLEVEGVAVPGIMNSTITVRVVICRQDTGSLHPQIQVVIILHIQGSSYGHISATEGVSMHIMNHF